MSHPAFLYLFFTAIVFGFISKVLKKILRVSRVTSELENDVKSLSVTLQSTSSMRS